MKRLKEMASSLKFEKGTLCTVDKRFEPFVSPNGIRFLGNDCIVIKETSSGLVKVALLEERDTQFCFPKTHIVEYDALTIKYRNLMKETK